MGSAGTVCVCCVVLVHTGFDDDDVVLAEELLELRGTLQGMCIWQAMAFGPDSVSGDGLRTANEMPARLERFWGVSQGFGGGVF